jgi:hypothetical protein
VRGVAAWAGRADGAARAAEEIEGWITNHRNGYGASP